MTMATERGRTMTRNHLTAALLSIVALLFPAAGASAMYHPTLGRFIQQNPGTGSAMRIGAAGAAPVAKFIPMDRYADGMNLYEYARSHPPQGTDPHGTDLILPEKGPRPPLTSYTLTFKATGPVPPAPQPGEIAVSKLLTWLDARYVYPKATGLDQLIRSRLVPALRSVSVSLVPTYKRPTYHWVTNEITLKDYDRGSILHESVHAYQDMVDMHDDWCNTDYAEGMAYATAWQAEALDAWFKPIEDLLTGREKAADAEEAVRSKWAAAWRAMTRLADGAHVDGRWVDKTVHYRVGLTEKSRPVRFSQFMQPPRARRQRSSEYRELVP